MEYFTIKEASEKWKISERMVRKYCEQDRIEGVIHVGNFWIIPRDASYPNATAPSKDNLFPLAKRVVYQHSKTITLVSMSTFRLISPTTQIAWQATG